jgi:hypothetical protein
MVFNDTFNNILFTTLLQISLVGGLGLWRHFQQYFSYIMAVSFIGGGNRTTLRKPPTCRNL